MMINLLQNMLCHSPSKTWTEPLLQLERLTKLLEQGKLISGAPIIYIDFPSHLSLVLELPRQYSHYALCHTLLLNQSVRDNLEAISQNGRAVSS